MAELLPAQRRLESLTRSVGKVAEKYPDDIPFEIRTEGNDSYIVCVECKHRRILEPNSQGAAAGALSSHSKSMQHAEYVALRLEKLGRMPTDTQWVSVRQQAYKSYVEKQDHTIHVAKQAQQHMESHSFGASLSSSSRSTKNATPQDLASEDEKNSPEIEDPMEEGRSALEGPRRKRLRTFEDISWASEEGSKDRSNVRGMSTRNRNFERDASTLSVLYPQDASNSADFESRITTKLDQLFETVRRQEQEAGEKQIRLEVMEKKLEEPSEDVGNILEIVKENTDRLFKLEADVEEQKNDIKSREVDPGLLHEPIEHQVLESGWKDSIQMVPTLEKDVNELQKLLEMIQKKVDEYAISDHRLRKLEKDAESTVTKIAQLEKGVNALRDSAKGQNCHADDDDDLLIKALSTSDTAVIARLASLEDQNRLYARKFRDLQKKMGELKH